MTMAEARVKQWGNSLGIVIPSYIAKMENLSEGDVVKIEIEKEKRINGFGMFKHIPQFKEDVEEHKEFW